VARESTVGGTALLLHFVNSGKVSTGAELPPQAYMPLRDHSGMAILNDLARHGGLAATHELLAAGHTQYELSCAVSSGLIIRIRQGWYGLPGIHEDAIRAVRVGGRLSCTSGAYFHSLWVLRPTELHVEVTPNTSRLRSQRDKDIRLSEISQSHTVVHWCDTNSPGTRLAVSARYCLRRMALCLPAEEVVAAADSAIRTGVISLRQWSDDIRELPPSLAKGLQRVDPNSESIIESLARFRLHELGFAPRLQVNIAGVGRVDLMLGDRLVIELDGWEYHSDREQFETDRRRDAQLSARGFRVLRFSYRQVTERATEVNRAIVAAVVRGDHCA